MRGFVKKACSLAGGLAVLGIAISIVGVCMGGRITNMNIRWDGNGPRIAYTELNGGAKHYEQGIGLPQGDVHTLEIDIGAAVVEIVQGDAYDLSVSRDVTYSSNYQDGVWEIESEDIGIINNSTSAAHYVITIPKDIALENVTFSIGAGALTATGLQVKHAEFEVGAGKMQLDAFSCTQGADISVGLGALEFNGALLGYSSLECGMGSIKMHLTRPDDYGYTVDNAMGSVKVGSDNYSGMAVTHNENTGSENFYDIECSMGSVKIEF